MAGQTLVPALCPIIGSSGDDSIGFVAQRLLVGGTKTGIDTLSLGVIANDDAICVVGAGHILRDAGRAIVVVARSTNLTEISRLRVTRIVASASLSTFAIE